MKARQLASIGCWLLIFPLVMAVAGYPVYVWQIEDGYFEGKALSDPIAFILSYLTPAAVAGVIGLAVLWRYGLAAKSRVILAAAIVLGSTLAPFIYGVWLWHKWNVQFDFLHWAWWL